MDAVLIDIQARLIRLESRLVQLMIHMGLDPYEQTYKKESPKTKQKEKA